MPTSPVIDIEALLQPVPGEDPAGDSHAYSYRIREKLETLRIEERPEDFDDATRPAVLKRADWPAVVKITEEALATESKDLRIACHLMEGLLKVHGFAGLRDGLVLLRRLLDECWDRLWPDVDDGDLDNRAAPLANMLDDPERGMRFPLSIRTIPLIGPRSNAYGLLEWNRLRSKGDEESEDELRKALDATDYTDLQTIADDCDECLAALTELVAVMDARLGSDAPALLTLGAAITECRTVVQQELKSLLPADAGAATDANGSAEPGAGTGTQGGVGSLSASIASRSEIYSQLNQAAEMLQQLEPHSPIPYLVKRAVELGRLPFPRLVKQLIRDANVLEELNREMGIKEPSPEEAAVS